jgi:hypothetical protein
MKPPISPYFTPITLTEVFTIDHQTLTEGLRVPKDLGELTGHQSFCGIPFTLGQPGEKNVILLEGQEVTIDLTHGASAPVTATYVIFLHAVEDRITNYLDGLADFSVDGNELGDLVADYALEYDDGSVETTPILRRFAIQQSRIAWGASAFAAIPALKPGVFATLTEEKILGHPPSNDYGRGETRHVAGRERSADKLWLYALPNPHPDKPIRRIVCSSQKERISSSICASKKERAVIYGITTTHVADHPLRPGLRQKVRLTLPEGAKLNKVGELEGATLDLGVVISARAALDYDQARWLGDEPVVQPTKSTGAVIIEYAAHPQAILYIPTGTETHQAYELSTLTDPAVVTIAPAHRPVTVRVVEQGTQQPVPVRIHFHGAQGEYLPPRGNHRKVNPYWFEDNYGEFVNLSNQYAYIHGECVVDLPLGEVYVEITKGYESKPVRTRFAVTEASDLVTFELEKVLHWREQGWVTADTHVHFLSPSTALLEGQAEGVHVVNLLASQWGEMFSNVTDFDGKSTLGAKAFGGDGEFLVRVGTENRMQILGHISLLGYSGQMIHPLCTGGPSESAIGDPQEVTMAEWAQRCIDQGGLVVMPHAPNPQLERAADIVLGLVHAIELMTFNPLNANNIQLNPYGLADWYRYLNLGYQVPLSGGSDKMSASSLLGGIRTYTHLGGREFTYEHWIAAMKAGNTFVTVGPLVAIQVEGVSPGGKVTLPATGGSVTVSWQVESVSLPIDQVEVVVGGLAVEQTTVHKGLSAKGSAQITLTHSTWIALRVRGSYKGQHGEIAAHSSAVQVLVEGKPLFSSKDATAVLEQIEGAIAYVDTIAPRPAAQRFKQMRATLEAAHNQLHQRMHNNGIFHRHTPLHDYAQSREH